MKFDIKKWEYGMVLLSFFFIVSVMFLFWPANTVLGGDDLGFHLNRILGLSDSLNQKNYPFYINAHFLNGYGYAANWFYPDLFLLPLAFYLKLGGSITLGYKVYLVVIQLLMVVSMYSCMYLLTKQKIISWLISWCYIFSSYRLIDHYVRGAVGENLAFLFYPLVVIGLYQLLYKEQKNGLFFLAFGFTGLVYSHVLSVVMMSIIVAVFCAIRWKVFLRNPMILYYLGMSVGLTILLGAFSLFPMLEQMGASNWYYQVHPFANLSSSKGYSVTQFIVSLVKPYTTTPNFIVGIGAVPVILIFSRCFYKGKKTILNQFARSLLSIGLVFLLMTTSVFPIKWFSILDVIQFSWRLNAISTSLLVVSGGIYFSQLEMKPLKKKFYFSVVGIFIILCLQIGQVNKEYQQKYAGVVDTYQGKNYVSQFSLGAGSEYLPATSSKEFIEHRGDKLVELNTNQQVAYTRLSKGIQFSTDFGEQQLKKMELPLIWYKGYEATLNGEKLPIEKNKIGLIQVDTQLKGTIQVYYKGTIIQKVAMIVSISTFLIMSGTFSYFKLRKVGEKWN